MRTLLCALAAVLFAACGGPTTSDLPEEPQIQPDRVELNFGADFGNAVYVDSSLSDTIQIKNAGKKDLTISKVELSGPDAAYFAVTGQPSTTVASTKATFIEVTYTPGAPGSHHATLTITSNAGNNKSLTITMAPSALWRYKTAGLVTSNEASPKALAGIKVTCVKPKGVSCTGDGDCPVASGQICVDLTCQHPKWTGWNTTTGADGKFSQQHSWECGEVLAEDAAATPAYASNVGPFLDGTDITIKLDGIYKVKGKAVEKGTATGLAGIKVTCMAPPSAPQSWKSWNVTTGGDGTFSNTAAWSCKELYAEDPANAYLPATGTWSTADVGVTIEMEKKP